MRCPLRRHNTQLALVGNPAFHLPDRSAEATDGHTAVRLLDNVTDVIVRGGVWVWAWMMAIQTAWAT